MKIETSRFGEIDFPEEVLIHFPEGVLGFPENRRYLLLEHDAEESPFKWLQSVEAPELAFIVMDPGLLHDGYHVSIDADTARMIELTEKTHCAYMAIVNIPADEPIRMSANLKAPLVVNPERRLGRQIIHGSQTYSVHEALFPRLNERLEKLNRTEDRQQSKAATG